MARSRAEYLRNWRKKNPLRSKAHGAKYRENNRDKCNLATKSGMLKLKYGITLKERDQMLAEQGGVCAGCGSPDPSSKYDWNVDHCHATGKLRGILCHNCNVALGRVHDSPYILRGLIDYLEKHNKKEAA